MRPCPSCQCFVSEAAERCPRCEASLERVLVAAGNVSVEDVAAPVTADPLVQAVFLGIAAAEAATEPAVVEPEPEPEPAPEPEVDEPVSFAALLGAVPDDHLLPNKPVAPPQPPAHSLVVVPVATQGIAPLNGPVAVRVRRRFIHRNDPFTRRRTRRELLLGRACVALAIMFAIAVVVLRLPIGARPELGASGLRSGVLFPVSGPVNDGVTAYTRADLRDALVASGQVFPVWNTYEAASPVVLHRALPELTFVPGTHDSVRAGQISVSGSRHRVVLAAFTGKGACAFARVIDQGAAQATVGMSGAACRASAAPAGGWYPLVAD